MACIIHGYNSPCDCPIHEGLKIADITMVALERLFDLEKQWKEFLDGQKNS